LLILSISGPYLFLLAMGIIRMVSFSNLVIVTLVNRIFIASADSLIIPKSYRLKLPLVVTLYGLLIHSNTWFFLDVLVISLYFL